MSAAFFASAAFSIAAASAAAALSLRPCFASSSAAFACAFAFASSAFASASADDGFAVTKRIPVRIPPGFGLVKESSVG